MLKMKELVELKTEKEKEVNEAKEAVELRLREVGNLVHDSVPYDNNEVMGVNLTTMINGGIEKVNVVCSMKAVRLCIFLRR
jgi:seryl-tRNA synthetase